MGNDSLGKEQKELLVTQQQDEESKKKLQEKPEGFRDVVKEEPAPIEEISIQAEKASLNVATNLMLKYRETGLRIYNFIK